MEDSLWRLYSFSATVIPLCLSTAWYTMDMLPWYMMARRSKSLTDLQGENLVESRVLVHHAAMRHEGQSR